MLVEISLTTPSTVEPLTVAQVKSQSRACSGATEDDLLNVYIVAARQYCETYLSRSLITQTWTAKYNCFDVLELLNPPIQTIDSVSYIDTEGNSQSLAGSTYYLNKRRSDITLAYGQEWPGIRQQEDAITVVYTTGYGNTGNDLPQDIVQGLLLLVGHFYTNREATAPVNIQRIELGLDTLWYPHRWMTMY